jgi:nucleotide-binding universal stress UspA family protein
MKIMIGYDGSNAAKDALKLAVAYATAFKAEVHVVTSLETGTEQQQEDIEAARNSLEWAEQPFKSKNIPCETHLLIRGLSAGEDLVQFAEEKQIDQVIVGVKRRSRVEKILMGSTAQYVIIKAPCPVVAVK